MARNYNLPHPLRKSGNFSGLKLKKQLDSSRDFVELPKNRKIKNLILQGIELTKIVKLTYHSLEYIINLKDAIERVNELNTLILKNKYERYLNRHPFILLYLDKGMTQKEVSVRTYSAYATVNKVNQRNNILQSIYDGNQIKIYSYSNGKDNNKITESEIKLIKKYDNVVKLIQSNTSQRKIIKETGHSSVTITKVRKAMRKSHELRAESTRESTHCNRHIEENIINSDLIQLVVEFKYLIILFKKRQVSNDFIVLKNIYGSEQSVDMFLDDLKSLPHPFNYKFLKIYKTKTQLYEAKCVLTNHLLGKANRLDKKLAIRALKEVYKDGFMVTQSFLEKEIVPISPNFLPISNEEKFEIKIEIFNQLKNWVDKNYVGLDQFKNRYNLAHFFIKARKYLLEIPTKERYALLRKTLVVELIKDQKSRTLEIYNEKVKAEEKQKQEQNK